jgi:hypothetical protein
MRCPSIVIQDTVSHDGERSTISPPAGLIDSMSRPPYACRRLGPASANFPIGVCVTTSIDRRIAHELALREEAGAAAVALLDDGATVSFIARYRKEATGALDDAQLRTVDERLRYLRELEERRIVIRGRRTGRRAAPCRLGGETK